METIDYQIFLRSRYYLDHRFAFFSSHFIFTLFKNYYHFTNFPSGFFQNRYLLANSLADTLSKLDLRNLINYNNYLKCLRLINYSLKPNLNQKPH